jgi:hypothetical protein
LAVKAALADLLPPTRSNVRWDTEEWSDLAQRVWKKRARNPDENLISLVNAAQMQQDWPSDRRRKITAINQVAPLVPLLRQIDLSFLDIRDRDVPQLHDQIESLRLRPDKETILQSLCAEEVCRRFTETVFNHCSPAEIIQRFSAEELLSSIPIAEIFAFIGQEIFGNLSALQLRLAEHLVDHQKAGATNGHTNAPLKKVGLKVNGVAKPKIAVLGMQQHYLPVLLSHVGAQCEIVMLPKASTREECAAVQAEHAVVWENYTTGVQRTAMRQRFGSDHLTLHRGTWNQLVHRIEALPIIARRSK